MMAQRWTHWVAGIGVFLATIGVGFAADRDPPFVKVGVLVGAVGMACFLLAGWVDFSRKSRP